MKKSSMVEILTMLGITYPQGRSSFETTCPVCEKSFSISIEKESCNCFHCGFHAGKIDMYGAFRHLSHQEAVAEITAIQKGEIGRKVMTMPEPVLMPKLMNMASVAIRHEAYTALLQELALVFTHKEKLLKRGLSADAIRDNAYASTPVGKEEAERIVRSLLSKGIILDGVPGFYKVNGSYHMVTCPSGILIPVRGCGEQRRIQSMQYRLDRAGDKRKYRTFSSSRYDGGAQSSTFVHYTGGIKEGRLFLTEGPLKADVAHHLTGEGFLAVTGVSALAYLPAYLQSLRDKQGLRKVYLAFDMDYRENDLVKKSLEKAKIMVESCGLTAIQVDWDPIDKGIDDRLLRLRNQK